MELDDYPQPHVIMKDILIKKLILRTGLPKGSRFLDIGCGRGRIMDMLLTFGFGGVGIDTQKICLEICEKRLEGKDVILKRRLRDVKGPFDLIIMSSVLEHIEDDQKYLIKISKYLKKGGFFLFTVPGDMRLYGRRDIAYGHYRRYERTELISKLKNADLQLHTLWSYGSNIISWIYRMIIKKELDQHEAHQAIDKSDNTKKSAIESDGFDKIKRFYPIYSKLMFIYKSQLLLLNREILRANYAGLFKKI